MGKLWQLGGEMEMVLMFTHTPSRSRTTGCVIPEETNGGDDVGGWMPPETVNCKRLPSGAIAASPSGSVQSHHSHHSHHNQQLLHNGHQLPQAGSSVSSNASFSAQMLLSSSSRKNSPASAASASANAFMVGRFSPCGSSPGDNPAGAGGYMLMSPREESKRYVTGGVRDVPKK